MVALRASLCATGGEVPYFDLCQFGQHNDLRGYESGCYRNRALFGARQVLQWLSRTDQRAYLCE